MKFLKMQSKKAAHLLTSVLSICLTFVSCAQPPANRAHAENPEFDKKISRMISFSVPTMSVQELKNQPKDIVILDAREYEEFAVSHIPNARYVGYDAFDADKLSAISKDSKIVLYCSIGYRSEKIGEKLMKMGYTDVHNLYGSIFEWVNQGNEVIDASGQPTQLIHTYNEKWSQWMKNADMKKTW